MTTVRQLEANRRNARLSTGPVTEDGKKRSRRNALRHGLTAETVIDGLEDADDYAAFEMAVTADFDAQSCVERELVLRLAGLLWRLRRAGAIERGLFSIQARDVAAGALSSPAHSATTNSPTRALDDLTLTFVRLAKDQHSLLERLSRYEARLWRQTRQTLASLHAIQGRSGRRRIIRLPV